MVFLISVALAGLKVATDENFVVDSVTAGIYSDFLFRSFAVGVSEEEVGNLTVETGVCDIEFDSRIILLRGVGSLTLLARFVWLSSFVTGLRMATDSNRRVGELAGPTGSGLSCGR